MTAESARAGTARDVAVPLALVATAVGLRASLLLGESVAASGADARGLLADVAVTAWFWLLLMGLARWLRPLAWAAAALWVVLHFASYEHLRVLGTHGRASELGFLADPTFVAGSAFAVEHPLAFALALLGTTGLAIWGVRAPAPPRVVGAAAVLALASGAALALWPASSDTADWRRSHFAVQNLSVLWSRTIASDGAPPAAVDARSALLAADASLAADRSGAPFVPLPGPRTNVILLLLESVSGVHVEPTAAAHRRPPVATMPRLASFGRENLLWTRFFSLQRKTNRGAYAVLCGDLPDLAGGTPKMSTYPAQGGRPCLPERLRGAGYRTAFVQAAPLGFMLKGQFMPRIGFEVVRGREWFERAYERNVWGVDDRAFFERSLDLVDELRSGDAPWMLTLLNVGTHHPYIFPDDFAPAESSRFVRALAYLDRAFGEFVAALEARGVLDDTLLVVTSDESMGIPGLFVDRWDQARTQSWGFLAVRLPQRQARQVEAPASQIDLALSILDAVGQDDAGRGLLGRSVFRDYARPRTLYFGNSNLGIAGELDRDGRLLICREAGGACRRWKSPDGRIFAPDAAFETPPDDASRRLARVVAASGLDASATDAPRVLSLVGAPVRLDRRGANEVVHGGQYVNLRPGDWLEVELEVKARGGSPGARGRLTHVLKQAEPPAPYVAKFPLRAGQTLRLRYSYAPRQPARDVQCASNAELLAGEALELDFETARMTVHRDGAPPAPGIDVAELAIEPKN